MRSVGEGFSFYFGGLRMETCSFDATFVIVTVYNEVAMAMPMASSAKVVTLGGCKYRIASFYVVSAAICDILTRFITC